MPEVNGWNVLRMWWEMTKLVLAGRGGYAVYVRVEDLSGEAQDEFNTECWTPVDLHWVGRTDRFVNITAEAEVGRHA